jgi:gluconolactonase
MKKIAGYALALALFVMLRPSLTWADLLTRGPEDVSFIADSLKSGDVVAEKAVPVLVSRQFSFTEGPASDASGNIYFTDQPNNKIWKYSTEGELSLFMEKTGRSNGLYFDKKGNLVACADEDNQLWSINSKKEVKVLLSAFKGSRFNGPNDLWIDAKNGIYFTDPYYQREYWERKEPDLKEQNVYYLKAGKKQPVVVGVDFIRPNGIIGTPDGNYLYIADIGDNKTYRYKISRDGSLQGRELFVNQGSDGMTIDNQGNIYLTGNGVTVYNAKGEKIKHIPIPEPWTANVTFGGKNKDILFITASKAVYTLKMNVRGAF